MKTLSLILICVMTFIGTPSQVYASTEIIKNQTERQPVAKIKPKAVEQNSLGIVSAVVGIAAIIVSAISLYIGVGPLSLVGFLMGIGATITGFISKKRINSNNGSGKGYSVMGIVTGLTTVISWIGITLLAIAALSAWGR